MKKASIHVLAATLGLAIGSAAFAQARHDEKPHGMPAKPSAAPDTPASERTPGRHDDRPHGKPKTRAKKAPAKKGEAKKDASTDTGK